MPLGERENKPSEAEETREETPQEGHVEENAVPQENQQDENSPSSEGNQEAPAPSQAGEKNGKKKKSRFHHEKVRLHKTKKIAEEYKNLGEKDETSQQEGVAKIDERRIWLAENYAIMADLKEEADKREGRGKEVREHLLKKIADATHEAQLNINNVKLDIKRAEAISEECDSIREILDDIKRKPNDYQTIPGYMKVLKKHKEMEKIWFQIPPLDEMPRAQKKKDSFINMLRELAQAETELAGVMGEQKVRMAEKNLKREEFAEGRTKALNSKYHERKPVIRLIRKAKKVESVTGAAPDEKADAQSMMEFIDEHITGSVTDIVDNSLSLKFNVKDERSSLVGGIKVALSALFGRTGVDKVEEVPDGMIFFDMISPILKAVLLCMHIKDFLKKDHMSGDEMMEGFDGIVGETTDTVIANAQTAMDTLNNFGIVDEIPILGPVLGLMSNAVSIVIQARNWHRLAERRDIDNLRKAEIKEKMAHKRIKYEEKGMKDSDNKELFGFMGEETVRKGLLLRQTAETKSHIAKNKDRNKRTTSTRGYTTTVEEQHERLRTDLRAGEDTNIYDSMARLKEKKHTGTMSDEEEKQYYRMKALSLIQEYRELKESKYVNEKRIRQGIGELVHQGVDVVKNILDMMPGVTRVIAKVLGITNTVSKYGHKLFTAAKQKGRDKRWWGDGTKTTQAKADKRSGFADDIYKQMIFVEGFMNPQADAGTKGTFAPLNPDTGSMVEKKMDYLDTITGTLGYKFSEMELAETKDALLDKMASAFGTGG